MKKFLSISALIAIVFTLLSFNTIDTLDNNTVIYKTNKDLSLVEFGSFTESKKTFPDKFVELRRDWTDKAPVPTDPVTSQKRITLSAF